MDRPAGCVVAGGRSSRMGRDKGAIVLAGETLLARALHALGTVSAPVFVAGRVGWLPSGTAVVEDATPDCGPMGGVAAALRFAAGFGMTWVLFLPVDMPLLPVGLLGTLLARWREAAQAGAWVCCAEADGQVQPLVSVVHVAAVAGLERSLAAGRYRLLPTLEAVALELAAEHGTAPGEAFHRTLIDGGDLDPAGMVWRPSAAECRRRPLWFSNVNTPEDLAIAAAALSLISGNVTRVMAE